MTLAEILSNEELRQREFPVTKNKIFLAHAGVCALPRRVAQAMTDCVSGGTLGDQEAFVLHRIDDARESRRAIVGLPARGSRPRGPDLAGPEFRRRRPRVPARRQYPDLSRRLSVQCVSVDGSAAKGVQVRLLNTRGLGAIRKVDVMGQVDENTRLVALASSHFISGQRLEHAAIGQFLRERGILFCLDAIQTLGAFPTTVEQVDFLAADAHKWLLGPCGAGVFYVKRELHEKLNPPVYGWHNVRNPDFVAQDKIEFRAGAAKFEAGTHNLIGVVGLLAAMELALELGVDNIAAELARKRSWLVPALLAKGFSVLNPEPKPEQAGGITSFFRPGQDLAPLQPQTGGRRHHRLPPHGPQRPELYPPLAPLLQHRRRAAPAFGIAVTRRLSPYAGVSVSKISVPFFSGGGNGPPQCSHAAKSTARSF